MKSKTARPFLLVMLFGFLASNGWMITEYGPGTGATGVAPPSATRGMRRRAAQETAAAQPTAPALQPMAGAAAAPTPGAEHPGGDATAPRNWLPAVSAPMLATATPVTPEATLPNDPASDLTFAGATNLASGAAGGGGGDSGAPPADPPVVGAQPSIGSTAPPPVSGGHPHAKELAEPGSLALLAAGLIVLGWRRRRACAV